ncbi:MAG: hypothetical protein EXR93_00270 [Gemmatimonadetes bacterium]|nr:hypothetical protein [Gemmatimonadota bacterium]
MPLLLSVEYRIELGPASFALCELAPVIAVGAALMEGRGGRGLADDARLTLLILVIAVTAFISIFLATDQNHALSAYRDLMAPMLLFWVVTTIRLTRDQVLALVRVAIWVAFASAGLGMIQIWTGRFLWLLRPEDVWWQEYKTGFIRSFFLGRWLGVGTTLPSGLFATTNNFAVYLMIPTLAVMAMAWTPGQRGGWWSYKAVFGVLLLCLVLTFSRSSLITVLMGWVVWRSLRHRSSVPAGRLAAAGAIAGGMALLIVVSGVVSFDALGTLRGRGTMIGAALSLVKDHPAVLATGGLTDLYRSRYYSAQPVHNVLLYGVVQYGLPATLAWLGLVLLTLARGARTLASRDAVPRALSLGTAIGVGLTALVYAQTTSFIDNVQAGATLAFWMGVVWQLGRAAQPLEAAPRSTAPAGPPGMPDAAAAGVTG